MTSLHPVEPLCRVTVTDISGREWICDRPVHAKVYKRRTRSGVIFENNPNVDRHYFVPRYPYRTKGQPE